MNSTNETQAANDLNLLCAHGLLMISAWQLMASVGLVVSRFYKPAWPKRQLFSAQIWFTLHRVCMVLTLLLDVAGFILIFVTDQSYVGNTEPVGYQQAHPAIGIVVTALVIANPIMALFRCKPDDIRRPWFTWFHLYVGYIAYILGTINIFFGLGLYFSQSPGLEIPSVWWLMGTSMVFHVFSEAVLQTHRELRAWQLAYRQKERQKAVGNGHDNVVTTITNSDPSGSKYRVRDPQNNASKTMAPSSDDELFTRMDYHFLHGYLLFYTAVIVGLWVAIVVLLSLNI